MQNQNNPSYPPHLQPQPQYYPSHIFQQPGLYQQQPPIYPHPQQNNYYPDQAEQQPYQYKGQHSRNKSYHSNSSSESPEVHKSRSKHSKKRRSSSKSHKKSKKHRSHKKHKSRSNSRDRRRNNHRSYNPRHYDIFDPRDISERIYINNFVGYPKEKIKEMCEQQGEVVDFMFRDKYALVEFQTIAQAQSAMTYFSLLGCNTEYSTNKRNKDNWLVWLQQDPRVYVKGFTKDIKDEDIREKFNKCGDIIYVDRKEEDITFIKYSAPQQALNCIDEMNGKEILGCKLTVEAAKPQPHLLPAKLIGTKVYVGNLSKDITEDEIRQEFSSLGKIKSINYKVTFAIVEYETKYQASEAISKLNGKIINGVKISVYESKSRTSKDHREGKYRGRDSRSYSRSRSPRRRRY